MTLNLAFHGQRDQLNLKVNEFYYLDIFEIRLTIFLARIAESME